MPGKLNAYVLIGKAKSCMMQSSSTDSVPGEHIIGFVDKLGLKKRRGRATAFGYIAYFTERRIVLVKSRRNSQVIYLAIAGGLFLGLLNFLNLNLFLYIAVVGVGLAATLAVALFLPRRSHSYSMTVPRLLNSDLRLKKTNLELVREEISTVEIPQSGSKNVELTIKTHGAEEYRLITDSEGFHKLSGLLERFLPPGSLVRN